jgi:hypothetical protein
MDRADEILDCVNAHLRRCLPECRRRTRLELELLLDGVRVEIAEMLGELSDDEDETW